jgi:hypothetical protein
MVTWQQATLTNRGFIISLYPVFSCFRQRKPSNPYCIVLTHLDPPSSSSIPHHVRRSRCRRCRIINQEEEEVGGSCYGR